MFLELYEIVYLGRHFTEIYSILIGNNPQGSLASLGCCPAKTGEAKKLNIFKPIGYNENNHF